jgi:hypothetical protein
MLAFSLVACAGLKFKKVQPCIVDKLDGTKQELSEYIAEKTVEGGKSYIIDTAAKTGIDPCIAHRILEVVSKEGLVLEGYTYEEFEKWVGKVKGMVEGGMSFGDLRFVLVAKFTDINKMIGAQVLILGDMFLELPDAEFLTEIDKELILSSLNDLLKEVKDLSIWMD